MKYLLLLVLITLCSTSVHSQQSFIEKYNLPVYDFNCTDYNRFWTNDVTIIIPDEGDAMMADAKSIAQHNKEKNVDIVIKHESELTETDYSRNLFVLGPIGLYKAWDKLRLPVGKLIEGFEIDEHVFAKPLHGFTYVGNSFPGRVAYIGNSEEAYRQLFNMPQLGLRFVVKNNTVPEAVADSSGLFDLVAFKEKHYTPRESKFYMFMMSADLSDEQLKEYDVQVSELDKQAEGFVRKLNLQMPRQKVKTYIDASQEQIKYMSSMFYTLKEEGPMYGYALSDEIHSWGFAGNAIPHEAGHWLINNEINTTTGNFISEGIQVWYMFTTNAEIKQYGAEMARKFAEEDLTDIITGKENFFQGDKYYMISGNVVEYLIETYGVEKFKELYIYNHDQMIPGFEKTYNKPLSVILEDYKKWLLK